MTKEEVVALMSSSTDANDWNNNRDIVKAACGGYPDFWYEAVIRSGLGRTTSASWANNEKSDG